MYVPKKGREGIFILGRRAKGWCNIMQIIQQVCSMCFFIFILVVTAFIQILTVYLYSDPQTWKILPYF